MVKDTLLSRINNELYFSKENLSIFEGLKRTVMRIDNNYWRHIQDEKNRL